MFFRDQMTKWKKQQAQFQWPLSVAHPLVPAVLPTQRPGESHFIASVIDTRTFSQVRVTQTAQHSGEKFPRHINSGSYTQVSDPCKPGLAHTAHWLSCTVESLGCCNKGFEEEMNCARPCQSFQVSKWHEKAQEHFFICAALETRWRREPHALENRKAIIPHATQMNPCIINHWYLKGLWIMWCTIAETCILFLIALTNCTREHLLGVQIATPPSGLLAA